MKVALAHDWFNTKPRGADRVTIELSRLFPTAPVFTLIYNRAKFGDAITPNRIKPSFLQNLPPLLRRRPRYFLPLIPTAINSWHLKNYGLIMSVSSAFAKNLKRPQGALHICYCCTPARFIWDYADEYMREQGIGKLQQSIAGNLRQRFKKWDIAATSGVDFFIADSQTVAKRIKDYYGRSATVIYPPVDVKHFKPMPKDSKQPYYVTLAGLTPYKKIDLAIEACNLGARRLIIIGDGNQRTQLEKIAGPTIEFAGYVSEERKRTLLAKAQGLIFPNEEDFGIAPVEAMAAGTPVVAYNKGGATESVIDGKTGLLFDKQTPEALSQALDKFESMKFETAAMVKQAAKFDTQLFDQQIKDFVKKAYSQHVKAT